MSAGPDFVEIFKAAARAQRDSRITASLMRGMATDLELGGPTSRILNEVVERAGRNGRILIADDLPGRIAAAVHYTALAGKSALSSVYPSAGGHGALHEVWPIARAELAANAAEIIARMLRPVRRSDPARAAMLTTALAYVGQTVPGPVRLFDVGAGAGLLMAADRYRQTIYDETIGPPDSTVHIDQPWSSPADVQWQDIPQIVDWLGADLSPLDVTKTADVRELLAWTLPDVPSQQERLIAACELVASLGLTIDPVPASVWLPRHISWPRTDAHSVIWHSDVVLDMTVPERTEFATALLGAGDRATATSPLIVCSFEPSGADDLLFRDPVGTALRHGHGRIDPQWFELRVTTWPGGTTTVLAHADHSGLNAVWSGPRR